MKSNMTAKAKNNKSAFENMDNNQRINFRIKILAWYDKHRRALPWRALKGQKPNPYYVWLSEVMLQQTTVVTVGPYFHRFIEKWPTVNDLASANIEDVMHEWAGLGYYARARNLYKCAQIISTEHKGIFPDSQENLIKLPGIGEYSSNSIAAIAYNKPANVVDGNVERVMARYFAITQPLPDSKKHLKELAGAISWGETKRSGDYAQALMDLGATICTPKSPKCMLCPLNDNCEGRVQGIADTLPAKKAKKDKPQKYGHVYWITREDGAVLFERRDDKQMLGGMLGLITSDWATDKDIKHQSALSIKESKNTGLLIKHSFTHFDLHLEIITAHLKSTQKPENSHVWIIPSKLDKIGLPTLFKKAVKLMI